MLWPIFLGHYAAPRELRRTLPAVSGSTRPAWMKSANADSLIRTWRPTLTNSIRRSVLRRRIKSGACGAA